MRSMLGLGPDVVHEPGGVIEDGVADSHIDDHSTHSGYGALVEAAYSFVSPQLADCIDWALELLGLEPLHLCFDDVYRGVGYD